MLQFLRGLFDPLFDLLAFILTTFHDWGAPWWLSIVMLTVVVRTVLFPLTVRQVKSMRKIQELRPEMEKLRKEHEGDPQKLQQEVLKLYTERGANPLGGFLPILVQLPIFLVLYYTIMEFETLDSFRTGGLFWFQDLTVADPFYILPVLYVATMMVSQEIAMKSTAPEQKRIMRFLPPVFGVVLAVGGFPAGLFVYWVASNVISVVQNLIVYRGVPPYEPEKEDGPEAEEEKPSAQKQEDGGAAPKRTGQNANGGTKTKKRERAKKR